MSISELLDELDRAHDRVYMAYATSQNLPGLKPSEARAAVDAAIKALQDAKDDMLDLLKDQKKEIDRLHGIEDRLTAAEAEIVELKGLLEE